MTIVKLDQAAFERRVMIRRVETLIDEQRGVPNSPEEIVLWNTIEAILRDVIEQEERVNKLESLIHKLHKHVTGSYL